MVQTGIPSNTIRDQVGQTGNLSEQGKSIMYNRIGKKNRMVAASARVAT